MRNDFLLHCEAEDSVLRAALPKQVEINTFGPDFGARSPVVQKLQMKNMEIAVVYYRSGYSASQMTEEDWETRLTIELSSAVKCPSLGYQLAGTKKVQQVLAQEGIVERFFPDDVKAVQRIRSTFVGSYSLDLTPEGDSAAQKAMRSPSKYVLKKEGEADDLVEMLVINSDFAHTSDSY
ncbi:hypothetical protein HPB49_007508 [Dermacentor silvarum]|uniref:Uncharacterized protein n=1 Tax=Dermacentor silvarum TaxID=543639 RepID=A0ACB8DAY7_DERSI|nr:hypothetical protein HPB49_007508 [Dermacentor silvarum]